MLLWETLIAYWEMASPSLAYVNVLFEVRAELIFSLEALLWKIITFFFFHCLYTHFIYILFKYIQQNEAKYTHSYLNNSQKHQLVKSAVFRQENISEYWFWLYFHNVHRPLTFLNCGEREFSLDSSMVWLLGGWPLTRKGPLPRLLKQQRLDSMIETKKRERKKSQSQWGGNGSGEEGWTHSK